ncbi:hypothetical protein [Brucella anthropi]|uniref:hypothetical protein n=1 Tax=Brucella anthropi TaxID=529 RepID=UPI003986E0BF
MKMSRFSQPQILAILRQAEDGIPAALSLKPGKFQFSVVQIRGGPHNGPELTSKWIISTGQGHWH